MRKLTPDAADIVNRAVMEILRGGEHLTAVQKEHSNSATFVQADQLSSYPVKVTFTYDLDKWDGITHVFGP